MSVAKGLVIFSVLFFTELMFNSCSSEPNSPIVIGMDRA